MVDTVALALFLFLFQNKSYLAIKPKDCKMSDLNKLDNFEIEYAVESKNQITKSGMYFIRRSRNYEACYVNADSKQVLTISRIHKSKIDLMSKEDKSTVMCEMFYNLQMFNKYAIKETDLNIDLS